MITCILFVRVLRTRLENVSDVLVFGGFSNSTGKSILNSLEAVYLSDVYVQEKRELQ